MIQEKKDFCWNCKKNNGERFCAYVHTDDKCEFYEKENKTERSNLFIKIITPKELLGIKNKKHLLIRTFEGNDNSLTYSKGRKVKSFDYRKVFYHPFLKQFHIVNLNNFGLMINYDEYIKGGI